MNRVRAAAMAVIGLAVGAAPVAAQGPPNPPVNLEADATSERVFLTWEADDSGNRRVAVAFRIYRDDERIGLSSDEEHFDFDVVGGREYKYQVSGIDILNREGNLSAPLTVVVPGGDPPDAPTNLVAGAVSASQIDLQWDAAQGDDDAPTVEGYYVYRDGESAPHDSTGGTQYSDVGLAAFTEYSYRVSAVSAGGVESALSDPASARTLDGSPPAAPPNVVAEATGAQAVELTWDAAEDLESGISLYLLYRDGEATPIDSTTATAYTDGTVEPETSYSYQVAARNGAGLEGPASDAAVVTTPAATDQSPPSVPADFRAVAVASDRVELTWSPAVDPESGVSAYRVYRDDSLLGTSPGVGYVDLTVQPSTTYAYEVAAVNGDGLESPRASAPPVTTPDPDDEEPADTVPPAPPSGLRVVTG